MEGESCKSTVLWIDNVYKYIYTHENIVMIRSNDCKIDKSKLKIDKNKAGITLHPFASRSSVE